MTEENESEAELNPDDSGVDKIEVVNDILEVAAELSDEPQKKLRQAARIVRTQFEFFESYAGPIPHPRIIEGWERVLPGSADRILALTEKQQTHRHNLEASVVRAGILHERIGMGLGFILAFSALLFGFYLLINGKSIEGFGILLADVGSIAVIYLNAKNRTETELKARKKALMEKPDDQALLPKTAAEEN